MEDKRKTFLYLYEGDLDETVKDHRFFMESWCKGNTKKKYHPHMDAYSFESDLGTFDLITYDSFLKRKEFPVMFEYDSVWFLDDPSFDVFKKCLATFLLHNKKEVKQTEFNIPYKDTFDNKMFPYNSRTLAFKGRQ